VGDEMSVLRAEFDARVVDRYEYPVDARKLREPGRPVERGETDTPVDVTVGVDAVCERSRDAGAVCPGF